MSNYWAIAIGINQYQRLQPLLYAQWDAHAMRRFWDQEACLPSGQCFSLTDASPSASGPSTAPTREAIQRSIVQICQQAIKPDDVLWLFWSGYAIQHQERDYLLPADGDPTQPVLTGIPMSELFATLRTAPTQNIVVMLDMKRAMGARSSAASAATDGDRLGNHTLALAEEHHMAAFLACQPHQFSHETLALRQGLFTAALLEGMRSHGCVTLAHLGQYLSDRLPQLSEQHWRPPQDPAIVIPAELRYQLLLPSKTPSSPGEPISNELQPMQSEVPGLDLHELQSMKPPEFEPPAVSTSRASSPPSLQQLESMPSVAPPTPASPANNAVESELEEPEEISADDEQFWSKILKWGGLLFGLLLIGVLVRNWSALRGSNEMPRPNSDEGGAEVLSDSDPASEDAALSGNLVFDSEAPAEGSPLDQAAEALAAGQPQEALQWLEQVPPEDQTETYRDLRAEAEQLDSDVGQTNRAILDEAIASMNQTRESTPVNQASDFHRAITQANRIQPGQPLYDEAQQAIQRWSRIILDLAEARAQTGDYADAIASAQLVPPSQPQLRQLAEQRISQWQEQVSQQSVNAGAIAEAEALIQPGQAASYSEAIAQLRTVQPGQPGYNQARVQIDAWGRDILDIAYERAAADDLYEAINTAALVPEDSSAYLEAREAIAGWRQQLRGL